MRGLGRLAVGFGLLLVGAPATAQDQDPEWLDRYRRAWREIEWLFEKEPGTNALTNLKKRMDALVDLYSDIHQASGLPPVSSETRLLAKEGIGLFLDRYVADGVRPETWKLLADLYRNRALITNVIATGRSREVIAELIMAHMSMHGPTQTTYPERGIPLGARVDVPKGPGDIQIVPEQVFLVADRGISTSMNRALDAGEEIEIRIALHNAGRQPWRSTSAYLEGDNDPNVLVVAKEVVYSMKEVRGEQTVSFGPGMMVAPPFSYRLAISPDATHDSWVSLKLRIEDTERGTLTQRLRLRVFNVGPVEPAQPRIDDDEPGFSDPVVQNGEIEVGETIEYQVPVRNRGAADVHGIVGRLATRDPRVEFLKRPQDYSELHYGRAAGGSPDVHPPSAFVFDVRELEAESEEEDTYFWVYLRGEYRVPGSEPYQYAWIRVFPASINVDPESEFRSLKSLFDRATRTRHDVRHEGGTTACGIGATDVFSAGCDGVVRSLGPAGDRELVRRDGEWILGLCHAAGAVACGTTAGEVLWLDSGGVRALANRKNWVRAVTLLDDTRVLWGDEEGSCGLASSDGRAAWAVSLGETPVMAIAGAPDGQHAAVGLADGRVLVLTAGNGAVSRELRPATPGDPISAIRWSARGMAWTGHESGTTWLPDGGAAVALPVPSGDRQRGVAIARRGRVVLSGGDQGVVRCWHTRTGRLLAEWPVGGQPVRCVDWDEATRRAAAGDGGGGLTIFSLPGTRSR